MNLDMKRLNLSNGFGSVKFWFGLVFSFYDSEGTGMIESVQSK